MLYPSLVFLYVCTFSMPSSNINFFFLPKSRGLFDYYYCWLIAISGSSFGSFKLNGCLENLTKRFNYADIVDLSDPSTMNAFHFHFFYWCCFVSSMWCTLPHCHCKTYEMREKIDKIKTIRAHWTINGIQSVMCLCIDSFIKVHQKHKLTAPKL